MIQSCIVTKIAKPAVVNNVKPRFPIRNHWTGPARQSSAYQLWNLPCPSAKSLTCLFIGQELCLRNFHWPAVEMCEICSRSVVPKLLLIAYHLWVLYRQHVPPCSRKSQWANYNSINSLENQNWRKCNMKKMAMRKYHGHFQKPTRK